MVKLFLGLNLNNLFMVVGDEEQKHCHHFLKNIKKIEKKF
jgi:hypothetical protein